MENDYTYHNHRTIGNHHRYVEPSDASIWKIIQWGSQVRMSRLVLVFMLG